MIRLGGDPITRTAPFILLVLAACSSSSSSSSSGSLPSAADVLAFSHATNIVPATVSVNGTVGILGVDTGSPFVVLNPTEFPSAPANDTEGTVGSFSVGSTTLSNTTVISLNTLTSPDPSVPIGGLLGCAVICNYVASFNYRDAQFTLGAATAPTGLGASTMFPFTLQGGGVTQGITVPKSRVVVTVTIEGASHLMILDTGASFVTLRSTVFATVTGDGRPTLPGGMIETATGSSSSTMARVRTIAVGGVSASNVVVIGDPTTDTLFDTLTAELGQTIDGSLGGTYLRDFYVTIDYPNQQVSLAPYNDLSWAIDPAERLGIQFGGSASAGYQVAAVVAGSDAAAKGVSVGDTLLAIDGASLASLSASQLAAQVSGTVGVAKTVQFGAARSLANQTVSILVDQLLAP